MGQRVRCPLACCLPTLSLSLLEQGRMWECFLQKPFLGHGLFLLLADEKEEAGVPQHTQL